MMKVSIIGVKGYPQVYGGYETLIQSIVRRFTLQKVHVTIYCHKSLFIVKPKQVNGVHLIYLPAIEKKSLSQLTHSFLSTLHACFSAADVVFYVNVANAPFGILPRLFGKKTVINVDGLEWLRPKWKGLGSIYYKICARLVKYTFNRVITDAIEMQRIYKQLFKTKSEVITYGAEHALNYSKEILSKFNLTPNEYYLVVGRMIPDNNLDFIIDEFLQTRTNKKLVIIGDDVFKGDFAVSIEEKIRGNASIVLTGYINDHDFLCSFYKYCFAYIHGHEFGGTNPTMIVAMNENCLILAIDTPFTREMLNEEQCGSFFKKQSQSLASLIMSVEQDLSQDLRNSYANSGKLRVQEHFNWDIIAQQYLKVFQELAIKH